MTVEAALIMPMVLAVIVILIYAAFCVYNRCVGYQNAYIACLREAQHKDAENSREPSRVEATHEERFADRYLMAGQAGVEGKVEGDAISCQGKVMVGTAPEIVRLLIPENVWGISFGGRSEVRDPPWKIRRIRRIAALARKAAAAVKEHAGGQP